MIQPGRTKASAARATGQQRPRENRAQTADRITAPQISKGKSTPEAPAGSLDRTRHAQTDGRHARKHDRRPDPPRRTATARRRTADGQNGKLYTAPARRNYPRIPRPGWTKNDKPEAPKPAKIHGSAPKNRRIPSRFSPFFVSILDFFSIFSRFSAVSIPSPSRFFSIQPADTPKISRFFRPNSRFSPIPQRPGIPQLLQFSPIPKFCRFFSISRAPSVLPFSPFCAIIFSNKFSSFRHKFPKHPIW